ncbi:hypothetical protein IWX90DRAFT_305581 [Phyllosticta citrichinensis]|uniref:Uncharacterized protein n=1 Tax=Phyllosticta citrichinensis TaxID=1130410 RepID=A0ABR1XLC0_9PEZI
MPTSLTYSARRIQISDRQLRTPASFGTPQLHYSCQLEFASPYLYLALPQPSGIIPLRSMTGRCSCASHNSQCPLDSTAVVQIPRKDAAKTQKTMADSTQRAWRRRDNAALPNYYDTARYRHRQAHPSHSAGPPFAPPLACRQPPVPSSTGTDPPPTQPPVTQSFLVANLAPSHIPNHCGSRSRCDSSSSPRLHIGLAAEARSDLCFLFFLLAACNTRVQNRPSAARAGSAVWSLTTWRAELPRTPDLSPFGLCLLMLLLTTPAPAASSAC